MTELKHLEDRSGESNRRVEPRPDVHPLFILGNHRWIRGCVCTRGLARRNHHKTRENPRHGKDTAQFIESQSRTVTRTRKRRGNARGENCVSASPRPVRGWKRHRFQISFPPVSTTVSSGQLLLLLSTSVSPETSCSRKLRCSRDS